MGGLRIAMLSYHTCPLATLGGKDTGGMNVYVRELTRHLGKMGLHVDVYTRSQDEHVPHVIHDLGYGNRVVHVPAGPEIFLPKAELAEHLADFVEGIVDFARRKNLRYDLIHSHYWMSGKAARALKEAWGVPVVHMFHTLGLMKNRIAGEGGSSEGDFRIQGEREVLKVADTVVAATPAELAQLQWLYEVRTEHITVIPPGVDVSRFYPIEKDEAKEYIGARAEDCMLLFVGRIEPLKGVATLLKALAVLREQHPVKGREVCLAIIGGEADVDDALLSAEMARLQALCEQLGLSDQVEFLGKQPQDELPYYYAAAEIVVVPSHYESFGMVALEAMACGTPVVASQVGGLAYLVKDGVTGYHVPSQDPQALAARLAALLNDPALHKQMSEQAVEYAQEYTWEKVTRQIVGLYGEVVGAKR